MKKKLFTMLLCAAMLTTSTVTAFAEESTISTEGNEEIKVSGTYIPNTSDTEVISVIVSWEAMNFTYAEESEGTWDASTHSYKNPQTGGWSDNQAAITVTNHSNTGITANFTFSGNTGIKGEFTETSLQLESADDKKYQTADDKGVYPAPSGITKFGIDSSSAAITESGQLGTITVAVTKVVDNSKIFFDADSLKNAGKVGNEISDVLTAALANAPKTGEVTLTMQMSAEYTTPDFYSINSALYYSDIESLNLTINGLTNITSELTQGGVSSFLNLNRICLPDVTTLGQRTLYGCTNLTHVELTAEGTITLGSSAFHDYYSKDIDLVLNTDKQDEVTGGNTWQGYTFKSITFVD